MTRLFFCGLIVVVIASSICSTTRNTKGDGIYFSLTDRSTSHVRGGVKSLRLQDLSSYGNFGLGKPDGTGGLIILDGVVYSIKENGSVLRQVRDMRMPTAAVKFFRADKRVIMKQPLTLAALESYLDSVLVKGELAAIKLQGRFARMKYRSFSGPADMHGVTEVRSFERQSIQGTMIGLYAPGGTWDLHGDGYHFHFIDRNRVMGGVVEDCVLKDVYIEIDYAQALRFSKTNAVRSVESPLAKLRR